MIFGVCNFMDGYSKKKHNWLLTDNINNATKNLYCLKTSIQGGLATTMVQKHGINGMILETVPVWNYSSDTIKYTGTLNQLQSLIVDLIGNTILTAIKNSEFLLN